MKKFFLQVWSLLQKAYSSRQVWIVFATIGIWMIVLQNFGVFSRSSGAQDVYVVGGSLDADVNGSVEIDGGYVSVDGTVDINEPISVWVDGGSINTW